MNGSQFSSTCWYLYFNGHSVINKYKRCNWTRAGTFLQNQSAAPPDILSTLNSKRKDWGLFTAALMETPRRHWRVGSQCLPAHPSCILASASSFSPQCLVTEKDQAPAGIGLISRVTGEMSPPTLVPRACFSTGNTKANVCTDLLDFQMLCFPKLSLS